MSDMITILRAHGRRLAKLVRADGEIEGYDKARTVDLFEIDVADLDALEGLLRRLEHRRDCCVVRGAIADPSRVKGVRRLLYLDVETGDEPTLRDVQRRWVALDIDSLPLPAWVNPEDLIRCARVVIERLPGAFQGARSIVQATASHGLKPGARLRLWYWITRPVCGDELKWWLRTAPVDPKIFSAGQITYTAAPEFLAGAFDPLPTRLAVMPGEPTAVVPAPDRLKPPPRPKIDFNKSRDDDRNERAIDGLVRSVAQAGNGNRNSMLYWASRRMAEKIAMHAIDPKEAHFLLEKAALQAGLSTSEAAATVRSGLRHGGA
jgi:hypothetical protein